MGVCAVKGSFKGMNFTLTAGLPPGPERIIKFI
jgi:hypothetical protein